MAEKFSDYSKIEPLLKDVTLPRMFRATQTFPNDHIKDVAAETRARLKAAGVLPLIRPGMTIATPSTASPTAYA